MIRSVPRATAFSFRSSARMGSAVSLATSFNPVTAGISAGVGLATAAIGDWMQSIQVANMGKSGATAIANEMGSQLTNLMNAYLNEANVSCADQRAALDAFDAALVWFQSPAGCGNPQFGSAGDRCISERAYPGAQYSYIDEIRDPIANDPRLAGQGCDTGTAVFLPSLSTGQYTETDVTSTGGSTSIAAPASATATQTASTALAATIAQPGSNTLLYAALGIGLLFAVSKL